MVDFALIDGSTVCCAGGDCGGGARNDAWRFIEGTTIGYCRTQRLLDRVLEVDCIFEVVPSFKCAATLGVSFTDGMR